MTDTEQKRRSIEKYFTWHERYGVQNETCTKRYTPEAKARLREEMETRFPLLAHLLREAEPKK